MRGLVPAEIAIVIALALVPLPDALPIAIPLVIAGSIAKWIRGRGWGDVIAANGLHAGVGIAAGVAAVVLALLLGTPLVEAITQRAVEWSMFAVVRGNASMLFGIVIYVATVSLCMELALRGWLVERVVELSPSSPVPAVLCGAFAEAMVTPGDATARIGAGVFGIGLGWMYLAAGRNVLAPMLARMAFAIAILVLESFQVIG